MTLDKQELEILRESLNIIQIYGKDAKLIADLQNKLEDEIKIISISKGKK